MAVLFAVSLTASAQAEETVEYERNSLYSMLVTHPNNQYAEVMEKVFLEAPFPERFNDHNLNVRKVMIAEVSNDIHEHLQIFSEKVGLGQKMLAKWFNRDKNTGSFNMDLVKQRGFYNASETQLNAARASLRGKALLEDAGEKLIGNTYLVVNDIDYQLKNGKLSFLKSMAASYVGALRAAISAMSEVGGFRVLVRSYLFRLVWNEEVANTFYQDYYTEDGASEPEKVEAFKQAAGKFHLEYLGTTESRSKETKAGKVKDPEKLLVKITTRAMDKNLAQLQHQYEAFRIKAPLLSVEPLMADIGLKEDVSVDRKYEVLERVMDEEGRVTYERVGVIRPVSADKIKDNRFQAGEGEQNEDDEDGNTAISGTEFVKVSGGEFAPGMLIREL